MTSIKRAALGALGALGAWLVLVPFGAWAQVSLTGAGLGSSPAAAYAGPNDVVAGAQVWYGLRAVSNAAAVAHKSAIVLCTALDAACETETLATSGAVSLGTVGATCNNTTVICTIKEWFDQIGALHLIQTTIANRATFKINCVGSTQPCAVFVKANAPTYTLGTGLSLAQPMTYSWVAIRTGSTASDSGTIATLGSGTAASDAFFNAANTLTMYAGSNGTITGATESVWHTEQSVYNGASSKMCLDGTCFSPSVNPGTGGTGTPISFGSFLAGNYLDGMMNEGGIWNVGFTPTQAANMNTNQKTYWGY